MSIEIRLLTSEDVAHFKEIRLEALREEPDAFASTVEDWLSLSDEKWLQRMAAGPIFVAFDDDKTIGIMGLLPETSIKRRHRAMLVMVYVRWTHRGLGIADDLLRTTIKHALKIGVSQIELHVETENEPAIGFYQRHGFAPYGRLPSATLHDGVSRDDLLMVCSV